MPDEVQTVDLSAPPPRETATASLKKQAEDVVRRHGVTFGNFEGKRCIYADNQLPDADYQLLANAMRKGLI